MLKQKRCTVPLVYDKEKETWRADASPTNTTIAGTVKPVTANLIHKDGVFPDADIKKVLKLKPTVEVMQ